MIKYGFDTDNSGSAVCAVHRWKERDIVAGYMLFKFGTTPPEYSVCPDSHEKSLATVESMLQGHMETLATDEGSSDTKYVATSISNILQQCNRRVYELAAFLGEGIALGGAVMFLVGETCIATAFGGAGMYFWDGAALYPQGDIPPSDGLVVNALGTRPVWNNKYWYGKLLPGQRFICTSDQFPDIGRAAHAVMESCRPGGHSNTVAMVLRKELELRDIPPTAILDIGNWEGDNGNEFNTA